MKLYIDSTDFNKLTYALTGDKAVKKTYRMELYKSYLMLQTLQQFLTESKIAISDIKKIIVNKGPGSHTGVRIGITHAQALSFAWGVPVKFLSSDKFVIR